MSDYDFIIDNLKFSYSSASTFNTCAYSYKLAYIDALPKENNFYSDYGTLVHECFEKYFTGEKESFELSQYYRQNYDRIVTSPPPASPYGISDKYKVQGQDFFDSFSFNKDDYDILLVEDTVEFDVNFLKVVARPDLVLKDKATGKNILYDYKTATPFWEDKKTGKEKSDKKKLEGYYQQMHIYTYGLRNEKDMPIDEIVLWFPRLLGKMVSIPWELERENDAIAWLDGIITSIRAENIFPYNNSNDYFCNNLCGVRAFCEYR
jgi:hypothetical protein